MQHAPLIFVLTAGPDHGQKLCRWYWGKLLPGVTIPEEVRNCWPGTTSFCPYWELRSQVWVSIVSSGDTLKSKRLLGLCSRSMKKKEAALYFPPEPSQSGQV